MAAPEEDAPQQLTANATPQGSAKRSPAPTDWFGQVTDQSRIQFTYQNGREAERFYLLESFGGGVAVVDFDRDGAVDLFFTGGGELSPQEVGVIRGRPSALFRNAGQLQFDDATTAAGVAAAPDYSQGCAATDFDADGFPDLYVCCYGRSRLYHNQGDGTYVELQSAVPATGWGTAAAFGDFDRDGFPDLLAARYVDWSPETDQECYSPTGVRDLCGPAAYSGRETTCQFFRNSGDGRFEDWSERVGMQGGCRGLGVVAADVNLDGWVDFYVANDESPKHLYLGGPGERLIESAAASGVALSEWGKPEGSMGIDVGDYDGDGRPDLWVTNFENEDHSLYRNLGDGLFVHATVSTGLGAGSRLRIGFGTSLADFDGDGWLDLFVLNGSPIYHISQTPFRQKAQLFRNLHGRRYVEVTAEGGPFFDDRVSGRGSAHADLDNDGALDLVIVPMNEPVRILKNRNAPANYVGVTLRATAGEPDATGARVSLRYGDRDLYRFAVRGASYFSQPDERIFFPAEREATSVDVLVEWPGREKEWFRAVPVRQVTCLIEGRGARR